MKFQNKLELANHINKFCADSIYGEPESLLKQLKRNKKKITNRHLIFRSMKLNNFYIIKGKILEIVLEI